MAILIEQTATLTAQNQITIPAPIRKALGLQGGRSKVSFSMKKDGTVLLKKSGLKRRKTEDDSALGPFLRLLDDDIRRHPERIKPISPALVKRVQKLIRNVKVDLNAPLPE